MRVVRLAFGGRDQVREKAKVADTARNVDRSSQPQWFAVVFGFGGSEFVDVGFDRVSDTVQDCRSFRNVHARPGCECIASSGYRSVDVLVV